MSKKIDSFVRNSLIAAENLDDQENKGVLNIDVKRIFHMLKNTDVEKSKV